MADQGAVEVAAPAAGAAAPEQQGTWAAIKGFASRMLMFYFMSSMIRQFMGGGNQGASNSTAPSSMHSPANNLFPFGTEFDLYIFLSGKDERFNDFDTVEPFWLRRGLQYGDWDSEETYTSTIPTPASLQRNQSYFLHLFLVKKGGSPNPKDRGFVKREVIYHKKQLNRYKKKFYKKTANLLTGKSEQSEEDLKKAETITHEVLNFWHPNLTINIVVDQTQWTKGQLPAPLDEAVVFDKLGSFYQPIVLLNDYWNLGSEYQPVNETVPEVNISLTYQPLSLFRYQLYASQQMRNKWSSMLSGEVDDNDDDQDTIKQALIETNPILLGVTVAVSILHTVFEFLAFKNDIQFWKSRKSLEGLSVRSVLFGVFQSLIVFLYICDNDTNFVVKVSVFVGLLIECWKVPKCMNVGVSSTEKWLGIIPKVTFADKGTYVESETKQYDQLAFKYLSWALYPLLAGYAVYSLMYVEQKGWYSWVLSMLYGFLLTFGFIMMTPQLFINYKLKSVAHLPWRMLSYKFINTFIDDLFAFVIRMPTMYRIGCFRDDIVFLVYIYQRWIYRVDPNRVNEFGTSMSDPTGAEAAAALEGEQPSSSADQPSSSAEITAQEAPQQSAEEKKTN